MDPKAKPSPKRPPREKKEDHPNHPKKRAASGGKKDVRIGTRNKRGSINDAGGKKHNGPPSLCLQSWAKVRKEKRWPVLAKSGFVRIYSLKVVITVLCVRRFRGDENGGLLIYYVASASASAIRQYIPNIGFVARKGKGL